MKTAATPITFSNQSITVPKLVSLKALVRVGTSETISPLLVDNVDACIVIEKCDESSWSQVAHDGSLQIPRVAQCHVELSASYMVDWISLVLIVDHCAAEVAQPTWTLSLLYTTK